MFLLFRQIYILSLKYASKKHITSHYLSIRQAALRSLKKQARLFFAKTLVLHYL